MTRIDEIESREDCEIVTLDCGHKAQTNAPNLAVGQPYPCPACAVEERRKGVQLPKPEDVLDAVVQDYVASMQAQGIQIGIPETQAIRRAANIQYAWYCAFRRVLG